MYLYDFGTAQDGRLYYVMELLDGISLQTLITTFGPQPASRVVAILKQVCRSLEEAHQQSIVHRDLKPSNVMICQVAQVYDFVKVLDFGLAKPFGTNRGHTSHGRGGHRWARPNTWRPRWRARARRSTHAPISTRLDVSRTSC